MANGNELNRIVDAARSAERQAAPWIETLARFGYAAKGVVYVLVGFIAASAAFGGGGDVEGSSGALRSLRDEPFGELLLWLIGIGLAGYVVWRAISALRNPEGEDTGKRVFYGVTAAIYAALALEAVRLATGGGGGEGSHWTATLLEQPFGRLLTGGVGLAIAAYGVQQLRQAWKLDFGERLDLGGLSVEARTWVIRFGRAGIAARGVVFGLLGYMFGRAAMEADASEADGVEGVLESMRDQPWLLGLVALGLIAYGLFNLVRARYRRIRAA